ncbi:MAG: tRNA (adenosine(37)-N6)-threonylcarbamoyltransferase complex ATPase subunit type 1 TsaE [Syntrophomonadaceae bacterium]
MEFTAYNEGEMESLGKRIARALKSGDVLLIAGDLGAGKTTLVRGIARGLGYTGRVTSPTFTLMNVYNSKPPLYHFDFYRLESKDLSNLGLEEYIEKEGICAIEWPAVGQGLFPEEAIKISIDLLEDDYDKGRRIKISVVGEQLHKRIEEIKEC